MYTMVYLKRKRDKMENKIDIKEVERLIGTEAELVADIAKLETDIATLNYYGDSKNIMICAHNTILAIKMFGRITHVVDTDEERNLKMIHSIDAHLSVPRYTPKSAKAWLNEDTKFGNDVEDYEDAETPEKVLLSEAELRVIVIENKQNRLEAQNRSLGYYNSLKVA